MNIPSGALHWCVLSCVVVCCVVSRYLRLCCVVALYEVVLRYLRLCGVVLCCVALGVLWCVVVSVT